MIQRLHLHPVSIAIIEREYRDHIVNGVLVLDKCIHLKDQLRGAKNNSSKMYPDYIKIQVSQKIENAQLRRAGHFLYRDAMHRLVTFIELVSSYGKMDAKAALFQFYEFYDIDPYDFNYETGQKIWTRSRQRRPEVNEILKKYKATTLEYNMDSFYEAFDQAASKILSTCLTKDPCNNLFIPRQLKYYVLKYKFGMSNNRISAISNASLASVGRSMTRFRKFLLDNPEVRKTLDTVVHR